MGCFWGSSQIALSLSLSLSLFPSSYQPCNANVTSPFKHCVHMQHVSRRSHRKKKMTLLCFWAERILALLYFLGLWYSIQKSIAGGMSGVFKHILRFFFNANAGAHNFKTGILVESPCEAYSDLAPCNILAYSVMMTVYKEQKKQLLLLNLSSCYS